MLRYFQLFIWLTAMVPALFSQSASGSSSSNMDRIAFVVGNNKYQNKDLEQLKNAVRDAKLMKKTLEKLGFEVIYKENLDKSQIFEELTEFKNKAQNYSVNLFYFAGHGLEVDGLNYILPTDAQIEAKEECETSSINVQQVVDMMEKSSKKWSIVVLDACRINPYRTKMRGGIPYRGFTAANLQSKDVIVAYSTSAMKVAMDGDHENSIYTKILCEELTKNQTITQVFTNNCQRVLAATDNKQRPEWRNQITEDIRLAAFLHTIDTDGTGLEGDEDYRSVLKVKKKVRFSMALGAAAFALDEVGFLQQASLSANPDNPQTYTLGDQPLGENDKANFDRGANGDALVLANNTFIKTSPTTAIPLQLNQSNTLHADLGAGLRWSSGFFIQGTTLIKLTHSEVNINYKDPKYAVGAQLGFLKKLGLSAGAYKHLNQDAYGVQVGLLLRLGKVKLHFKGYYERVSTPVGDYNFVTHPKGLGVGFLF